MSRPLAIANLFGLPAFAIFDGDCDKAVGDQEKNHVRDNSCLFSLAGHESAPLPEDSAFGTRVVMWRTRIMDVIKEEVGEDLWEETENAVRNAKDMHHNVKSKNPLLVAATLEALLDTGIGIGKLERLGNTILAHAAAA